ncbi:hypothetical protein GCM10029964_089050 [Kibdelosporangium lantanae]
MSVLDWPTVVSKALDHWWVLPVVIALNLTYKYLAYRQALAKVGQGSVHVEWRMWPPKFMVKSDGPDTDTASPTTEIDKRRRVWWRRRTNRDQPP